MSDEPTTNDQTNRLQKARQTTRRHARNAASRTKSGLIVGWTAWIAYSTLYAALLGAHLGARATIIGARFTARQSLRLARHLDRPIAMTLTATKGLLRGTTPRTATTVAKQILAPAAAILAVGYLIYRLKKYLDVDAAAVYARIRRKDTDDGDEPPTVDATAIVDTDTHQAAENATGD